MSQKFAAYDANGNITAYYDSVDSPAPVGVNVVAITDAQWQTCLSTPGHRVRNGQLVAPTPPPEAELLAQAKQAQSQLIYDACARAITAGYMSSALGYECEYASMHTDQANLLSLAQAGQGGSVWCASKEGWTFVPHTAEQVTVVLTDWVRYRDAQQSKYAALLSQINAATTISAVQAITMDGT